MTRTISATDTAKLVRAALKAAFPGTRFSVRTDSSRGGAAIHVSWMDGPAYDAVAAVARDYEGASFDARIDLKSHHPRVMNGELVQLMADFVLLHRTFSGEALRAAAAEVARRYDVPVAQIAVDEWGARVADPEAEHRRIGNDYHAWVVVRTAQDRAFA